MSATTTLETVTLTSTAVANTSTPQTSNEKQDQCFSTGGYHFPGIPKFDDPYKSRRWQLEHMAAAFRVFARKGYTEGTAGHISLRDPVQPNTFWINP